MTDTIFKLVEDAEAIRQRADQIVKVWKEIWSERLPEKAEIIHVGATAVVGCETKGDIDIAVRVDEEDFLSAQQRLNDELKPNPKSVSNQTFSAFESADFDLPLGVQLVVKDGPYDVFLSFLNKLKSDSKLRDQYNALKRSMDGRPMSEYRKAKSDFIAEVLGFPVPD